MLAETFKSTAGSMIKQEPVDYVASNYVCTYSGRGRQNPDKFPGRCHYCNYQGHKSADCMKRKREMSAGQHHQSGPFGSQRPSSYEQYNSTETNLNRSDQNRGRFQAPPKEGQLSHIDHNNTSSKLFAATRQRPQRYDPGMYGEDPDAYNFTGFSQKTQSQAHSMISFDMIREQPSVYPGQAYGSGNSKRSSPASSQHNNINAADTAGLDYYNDFPFANAELLENKNQYFTVAFLMFLNYLPLPWRFVFSYF